MKPLSQNFVAALGVIPAYVMGWCIWNFGRMWVVFPAGAAEHRIAMLLLPPLVLPALYLAWIAARRRGHAAAPRRRLVQFGIAAGLGVAGSVAHTWWSESNRLQGLPTAVAFALMLIVALLALAVDRDVELSLRLVLVAILAIVPVILAGRVLAIAGAFAAYTALRALHGSTS